MAKELPYFKFEPSQWENGNIQLCSFEAQGIFVNVCSMYWQRLGNLPYKLAVQKVCKGNATALDSLIDEQIIKVVDGDLCIDFLNEQLSEFENTSKVNSENARSGWLKRKKQTTPMRPHSDPNAIREEKRRGKKIKREDIPDIFFGLEVQAAWEEWKKYKSEKKQKLTPSTEKKQMQFLGGRAGPEAIAIINQSITNGWTGLFELKQQTNGQRTTNQGPVTTAIIEPGKDFGVNKGFSRSGPDRGGNGSGAKTGEGG